MTNTDHITSGPITRTIFSLSIPVVLNMFMEFALTSTDYFWVGKLGSTAQDAVTSSMVVIWTVFAFISIICIGVTALVSRYIGARNPDKAAHYARQGLALAVGIGLTFSLAGIILTPSMLNFMDTSVATSVHAVPYLRISFGIAVLFFILDAIYAIFRASGDTRTPTKVGMVTVVLNMALDPLFIFGLGPIPAMGVPGAALATGVSVLVGVTWITVRMMRGGLGFDIGRVLRVPVHIRDMLKIIRIGLPIASQQLVFVVVYWFLIKYVHEFGEVAAAAMGIGNRMESLSYLTCFGVSIAASTMVGQNLGAGKPDRAARCAWGATGIAIGLTLVTSLLFILLPRQIASIFTDDPEVLHIAADYLVILGLSQTAMAIEIVLEGAFGGAGDTIPPMVVSVPGSLARIPMAYFLCFTLDWGINGIWWTLTITTLIKAIILGMWFKMGNWKKKQL
ncbi:MAG: MATE family efflux transporter [candidate division Zixibacteria bacterium]|nr:MATE family efflux transporter [candidate division Zixibacteria bacterium]